MNIPGKVLLGEARIVGNPVGKGRARITTVGGFARAYTPHQTRVWETAAAQVFAEVFAEMFADLPPAEPLTRYLMSTFAVAARPARLRRKKDPDGYLLRPHKPDADNVIKAAQDALQNSGAIADDCLIVHTECTSLYAPKGMEGFVLVRLYRLDGEPFLGGLPPAYT
jgi:Holliday junction resolvase RusA-like endonuclease